MNQCVAGLAWMACRMRVSSGLGLLLVVGTRVVGQRLEPHAVKRADGLVGVDLQRAEFPRADNRLQRENHAEHDERAEHEGQHRVHGFTFHKGAGNLADWRRMSTAFFARKRIDFARRAMALTVRPFSARRGQRRANRIDGKREAGAARHHVPRRVAERPRGARAHLRQDAQKLHPHLRRRQGQRRDVALRPEQGAHHLPARVISILIVLVLDHRKNSMNRQKIRVHPCPSVVKFRA